jgi:dienelactone hydrolase
LGDAAARRSGLRIFEDETHYFHAADAMSSMGFDVLVVDYKRAFAGAQGPSHLETGGKIAWVVERVVDWARAEGVIREGEKGAVVAWSLGAEGLWPLLSDERRVAELGLVAAVVYYPSTEDDARISNLRPLLVLSGESDDVTSAATVRAALGQSGPADVDAYFYAGAQHGFDVVSLQPAREVRLLPLIGPSGTFGYDARAAEDAATRLRSFLEATVPVR